ncbi:hypothetical protein [Hyphomonas sp.]|uniref:hypothetical protein n=1 Tax=Hyphomonas sp. TaxID=87 RepID=UPI0025BBE0F9|nr:hypothetical protein [Hyphomonas sp.]
MPRKTLDHLGYPRTTAGEAHAIREAADRRRAQMLPGNGPASAEREPEVSHYKGEGEPVALGPRPDDLPVAPEVPDQDVPD